MELLPKEPENFPNYLVYPNGDIKSKKTGRMLKPHKIKTGYHNVILEKNGRRRCASVHRLVGECHIDNPENKPQIDHIDRNPSNNDISNLRWATLVEQGQNKGISKLNTTGYKNIHYHSQSQCWVYSKEFNRQRLCYKRLKSLEEALEFKKNFEKENNIIV